jgi:hypothetical protein
MAVGSLCLVLGVAQASIYATWLAALGFGSLYGVRLYTSDPLMFLLGPLLTAELLSGCRGRSTVLGAVGVLAKEFAAAPLWIHTLWSALQRKWDAALRSLLAASTVTMICLTLHLWLVVSHNYGYGGSASARPNGAARRCSGAGDGFWGDRVDRRALAPGALRHGRCRRCGLLRAPESCLLVVAAIPAAVCFAYVQQPDRALWNFHFLVIPIAVLALENLPAWCVWLFIALFALANLRVWRAGGMLRSAGVYLAGALDAGGRRRGAVTMFRRRPALVTTLA